MNYRDVLHEVRHGRLPKEPKEPKVGFKLSEDAQKQLEDFKAFMRGKGHSEEIIAEATKIAAPELERECVADYCERCAKSHKKQLKGKPREFDEITKPKHYTEGRAYEPKDVIRDWDLNFNLGNAVKYISRAGRKRGEDAAKDLQKAVTYLSFELEAIEKERENDV